MIKLTVWNTYVQFGGHAEWCNKRKYIHDIFSSAQTVYVFWLVHLINLHLR